MKDPIQDELDTLNDQADAVDRQKNLEQALYDLRRAENQKSNLVYTEEGFKYITDDSAISEARSKVDDARLEITKADLQSQIDALDDEIDRYNDLIDAINKEMDAINEQTDEQIAALERTKNKWQEVIDQQELAQNMFLLTSEFGQDAVTRIINGDEDLIAQWKVSYLTTIADIDRETNGTIGGLTTSLASLYGMDASELRSQFDDVNGSVVSTNDSVDELAYAINGDGEDGESLAQAINEETDTALEFFGQQEDAIRGQMIPAIQDGISYMEEFNETAGESIDKTVIIHYETDGIENAYASGTKNARKGLAIVGEEKPEVIVTNSGNTLLAQEPTLVNMQGGETVYDGNETEKMLDGDGFNEDGYRPVNPDDFPLLKALSQYSSEQLRQHFLYNNPNALLPSFDSVTQQAINNVSTVNNNQSPVNTINIQPGAIVLNGIQDVNTLGDAIVSRLPHIMTQKLNQI
jgi:transcription elongation factor Elf1